MLPEPDGAPALPDEVTGTNAISTREAPPCCDICGRPFKADDEDDVILIVRPALLETSRKSGRLRMVECDFNIKGGGLDGVDFLRWHFLCLVEQLQDSTLIGYYY